MIGTLIAKSKIRSGFKALSQHHADEFLKSWADDATWTYPGNISVSGEFKGKEAVAAWFGKFMAQFPQINFTIKHICVKNIFDMIGTNNIAVHWDINITNRDGNEFQNSGVTTITLKMGKAVAACDYIFDLEKVKKAWGEG